ncbi:hypothetical protein DLREEDagr8_21810 [Dongia sp. agr-C8]
MNAMSQRPGSTVVRLAMIAGKAIDQIRRFKDGGTACPGNAEDRVAVSCGKSDDDME